MLHQIENELFTITSADKIHFRTLEFDQLGVERREHATKRQTHVCIRGADLPGENLRIGITGGTQETEPHENRLESVYLIDDDFVGRFRIRLVEHKALVRSEERRVGKEW